MTRQEINDDYGITLDEGAEVVYHHYDTEWYEGWSLTIYRLRGKLFEVNSSHCSCDGLEWDPERTTLKALRFRFKNGGRWPGLKEILYGA
jgi:hypothetical protein